MKVSNNNRINNYSDIRLHTKESPAPSTVSGEGHSFDAIIIQSDPREVEERSFAESLTKQLSSEVKNSTASAERLETLKGQIQSRTYQVDAYAIAARMLLV